MLVAAESKRKLQGGQRTMSRLLFDTESSHIRKNRFTLRCRRCFKGPEDDIGRSGSTERRGWWVLAPTAQVEGGFTPVPKGRNRSNRRPRAATRRRYVVRTDVSVLFRVSGSPGGARFNLPPASGGRPARTGLIMITGQCTDSTAAVVSSGDTDPSLEARRRELLLDEAHRAPCSRSVSAR